MSHAELIEEYLAGPGLLREAVAGLTAEELNARPIPDKWSTRQVIYHIADFEPVYADRMKRVIAEDNPPLRGGDPDVFAAKLAYDRVLGKTKKSDHAPQHDDPTQSVHPSVLERWDRDVSYRPKPLVEYLQRIGDPRARGEPLVEEQETAPRDVG